jgi:hypothetical protein
MQPGIWRNPPTSGYRCRRMASERVPSGNEAKGLFPKAHKSEERVSIYAKQDVDDSYCPSLVA